MKVCTTDLNQYCIRCIK